MSAGDFERKRDVLHARCQELGRDPGEITISSHVWFDPAEHEPGHVADESRRLDELGVDLAIVYLAPPISAAVLAPLAELLSPLRG